MLVIMANVILLSANIVLAVLVAVDGFPAVKAPVLLLKMQVYMINV
jgi:hypothetical protein